MAAVTAATALAVAACGSASIGRATNTFPTLLTPRTGKSTTVPPTTVTSSTAPPTTTAPTFTSSVATVTPADVPHSWHSGCPVGPGQLRRLGLTYWGFDRRAHAGAIVVSAPVVADVVTIFRTLYTERFPIRQMVPVDAFGGSDNAAAAADDTSGFNCRYAVAPGPPQWSEHAYGEAIDVNDVENPYIQGATIIPPAGAAYTDRSRVRPGMAVPGGELVRAFAAVGWQWGGRWTAGPDYQHFSKNGG